MLNICGETRSLGGGAWVQQNPALAPLLRKVDRHRVSFVRLLFLEMGFDEDEADTRTRIFLTYMITQRSLLPPTAGSKQFTDLRKRAAFFTHHQGKHTIGDGNHWPE